MYFFMILLWALFYPVILLKCGKITANVDPPKRIIGGDDVKPGEIPWLVSLTEYNYHVCGGSIIDKDWVLTAGHCIDRPTYAYEVIAGRTSKREYEPTQQMSSITKIFKHRRYYALNDIVYYDIALLRLSRPLNITGDFVRPICLPEPNEEFTGNCQVAGWGTTTFPDDEYPTVAQKVTVPLITNEECRTVLAYIKKYMLCHWYKEGGKDACTGDSGGPVICVGADNRHYLSGIVSTGIGCAQPQYPAINTKVSYFISWIYDTLQEFKNDQF